MERPQVWDANSSTWNMPTPAAARPETNACRRQGTSTAGWSDLQGVGEAEGRGLATTSLTWHTHEVCKDPLRLGRLSQELLQ